MGIKKIFEYIHNLSDKILYLISGILFFIFLFIFWSRLIIYIKFFLFFVIINILICYIKFYNIRFTNKYINKFISLDFVSIYRRIILIKFLFIYIYISSDYSFCASDFVKTTHEVLINNSQNSFNLDKGATESIIKRVAVGIIFLGGFFLISKVLKGSQNLGPQNLGPQNKSISSDKNPISNIGPQNKSISSDKNSISNIGNKEHIQKLENFIKDFNDFKNSTSQSLDKLHEYGDIYYRCNWEQIDNQLSNINSLIVDYNLSINNANTEINDLKICTNDLNLKFSNISNEIVNLRDSFNSFLKITKELETENVKIYSNFKALNDKFIVLDTDNTKFLVNLYENAGVIHETLIDNFKKDLYKTTQESKLLTFEQRLSLEKFKISFKQIINRINSKQNKDEIFDSSIICQPNLRRSYSYPNFKIPEPVKFEPGYNYYIRKYNEEKALVFKKTHSEPQIVLQTVDNVITHFMPGIKVSTILNCLYYGISEILDGSLCSHLFLEFLNSLYVLQPVSTNEYRLIESKLYMILYAIDLTGDEEIEEHIEDESKDK